MFWRQILLSTNNAPMKQTVWNAAEVLGSILKQAMTLILTQAKLLLVDTACTRYPISARISL